ncbi:hypothetical protein IJT93_11275 [bacterium]|nr:hypothetical protein [bacterium]
MSFLSSYSGLIPLLITASAILASLLTLRFLPKQTRAVPFVNILGLLAAAGFYGLLWQRKITAGRILSYWDGIFTVDALSCAFGIIICLCGALVLLTASSPKAEISCRRALLTSVSIGGGLIACSAKELLTCFAALELLTLPIALMLADSACGGESEAERRQGLSAGLKYFLTQVSFSAIFLYGVSFIFGTAGSTFLEAAVQNYICFDGSAAAPRYAFVIGAMFITAGLCGKLGSVPFNIFSANLLNKSCAAVNMHIAAPFRAALAAVMLRIVWSGLAVQSQDFRLVDTWIIILGILGLLSLFTGAVRAYKCSDLKDFSACFSLGQIGLILLAVMSCAKPLAFEYGPVLTLVLTAFFALSNIILYSVLHICEKRQIAVSGQGLARHSIWAGLLIAVSLAASLACPPFLTFTALKNALTAVLDGSGNYNYLFFAAACGLLILALACIKAVKTLFSAPSEPDVKPAFPLPLLLMDTLITVLLISVSFLPQLQETVLLVGQNFPRP